MNKSEILFYYEVKNCNPNGDPLEADAPRKDGDHILVSDVRLKRTIRDYWHLKGKDNSRTYFLRKEQENGNLYTREELFGEISGTDPKSKIKMIFDTFVDMRLFGAVFALKKETGKKNKNNTKNTNDTDDRSGTAKEKSSYNFTGAVQFSIGKSKHKASDTQIKGTTVVPSGEGKDQGTFTNRFVVPYALIEFYGIINPNNYPENLKQNKDLFKKDEDYLCEGMWEGTRNLLTRSKIGHRPALIIKVNYFDDKFIGFIGDYVNLETKEKDGKKVSEKEIRCCDDYTLKFDKLVEKLKDAKSKNIIESVELRYSDSFSDQINQLKKKLEDDKIKVTVLSWDDKHEQKS